MNRQIRYLFNGENRIDFIEYFLILKTRMFNFKEFILKCFRRGWMGDRREIIYTLFHFVYIEQIACCTA